VVLFELVVQYVRVGEFRVQRVDDLFGFVLIEAKFVLLDDVGWLTDRFLGAHRTSGYTRFGLKRFP
jgi:hypothetical protein